MPKNINLSLDDYTHDISEKESAPLLNKEDAVDIRVHFEPNEVNIHNNFKGSSQKSLQEKNNEEVDNVKSVRNRNKAILILNVSSALDGCDEQLLPASFRAMEIQLHLHPKQLGQVAFAQSILMSVSCPIWGYLADHYSRKKIMSVGMVSWGISTICLAFVSSLKDVLLLRMLNGIFLGSMGPISQSLLTDLVAEGSRGLNFGILQLFTNFGRMLGGVVTTSVGTVFIMNIMGWRFCFICVGILSCILGVIIEFFVTEFPQKISHTRDENIVTHPELPGTGSSVTFDEALDCEDNANLESQDLISHPVTNGNENQVHSGFFMSLWIAITNILHFIKSLTKNLAIPSVFILLIEGIVGTIPWSSLAFITMFFQYTGLSDLQSGIVTGVLLFGAMIGGPLGGFLGDRISEYSPNHGRIYIGQLCMLLRLPILYGIFNIIPFQATSFIYFVLCSFTIGILSVGGVVVNRPLLSEIVPPTHKASVFAIIIAIEGICASLFGAPVVGLLAENIFGYVQTSLSVNDIPAVTRKINAEALSHALFYLTCTPWSISVLIYSILHFTYGKDRIALRQSDHQSIST